MAKDLDLKLKEMDQKIKQLQEEKQMLLRKSKEEERKKRTRELIQVGAILDSIGIHTPQQAESLKQALQNQGEILKQIVKSEEEKG